MELLIQNGDAIYQPVVVGDITFETHRKGSPGELHFSVVKDDILDFTEGNPVRFKSDDGSGIFYGFIFKKERAKDGVIKVTAYDQLRYLKNKDTIVYSGKRADQVVSMVSSAFSLQTGSLANTGYVIWSRIEDNKTMFDIIQNALDETLQNTRALYVLYDDFGKLALKNIEDMKIGILIDQDTAEDYSYSSSIDGETYNRIKIIYENKDTGKRDVYIAQDSATMNAWGTLQYFEKANNPANLAAKANALLGLYDRKERTLSIKNAIGDASVRAGCSVPVMLSLDDVEVKNYMVAEKVKHTFRNGEHWMDLTLIGGDFIA